jgi:hypothetical protein
VAMGPWGGAPRAAAFDSAWRRVDLKAGGVFADWGANGLVHTG